MTDISRWRMKLCWERRRVTWRDRYAADDGKLRQGYGTSQQGHGRACKRWTLCRSAATLGICVEKNMLQSSLEIC